MTNKIMKFVSAFLCGLASTFALFSALTGDVWFLVFWLVVSAIDFYSYWIRENNEETK